MELGNDLVRKYLFRDAVDGTCYLIFDICQYGI